MIKQSSTQTIRELETKEIKTKSLSVIILIGSYFWIYFFNFYSAYQASISKRAELEKISLNLLNCIHATVDMQCLGCDVRATLTSKKQYRLSYFVNCSLIWP